MGVPMTREKFYEIDNNETKARTILKMLLLLDRSETGDDFDVLAAIQAAYDYLETNDQIFTVSI